MVLTGSWQTGCWLGGQCRSISDFSGDEGILVWSVVSIFVPVPLRSCVIILHFYTLFCYFSFSSGQILLQGRLLPPVVCDF